MHFTKEAIQSIIRIKLPADLVVPEHSNLGHFYRVHGKLLPSVTGALKLLKDESLQNWKVNTACQYILEHADRASTLESLAELIVEAKRQPQEIFTDAGSVGTDIHSYREQYFSEWIVTNKKPAKTTDFIPADENDIRAISAMRALQKFVDDYDYVPIACEVRVYSEKYNLAGSLDDIGFLGGELGDLVILDLKSSNYLHDIYWKQVAMYYMMFKENTGLKPKKCYILQVSKINGTYKLEEIKQIHKVVNGCKALFKVNACMEMIKNARAEKQTIQI